MPCWSSLVRTPPSQGGDHRFKSGTGYEVQVQPPDLPDRNPGGFVYSAALPRACFFREECWAAFILLTRVKVLIAIF